MKDLTPNGTLAYIDMFAGQCAAAFYQEVAPGRFEPVEQEISRERYGRLAHAMAEYESPGQCDPTYRSYNWRKQAQDVDDYIDALRERNEMAAAAARGAL